MSVISISSDVLSIRFTRAEKLAGLVRDVDVPLRQVTSVASVPDGLSAARGVRAPGLGVPGRRKIGTWRRRDHGRTLVDVRRGRPALRVGLHDHHYAQLLIGTPDAASLADRLSNSLPSPRSATARIRPAVDRDLQQTRSCLADAPCSVHSVPSAAE